MEITPNDVKVLLDCYDEELEKENSKWTSEPEVVLEIKEENECHFEDSKSSENDEMDALVNYENTCEILSSASGSENNKVNEKNDSTRNTNTFMCIEMGDGRTNCANIPVRKNKKVKNVTRNERKTAGNIKICYKKKGRRKETNKQKSKLEPILVIKKEDGMSWENDNSKPDGDSENICESWNSGIESNKIDTDENDYNLSTNMHTEMEEEGGNCGKVGKNKSVMKLTKNGRKTGTENYNKQKGRTLSKQGNNKVYFLCQICGRSFPHKQTLDHHIFSHTGERPYRCDFENCNRAFISASKARVHRNAVHFNIRRYECIDCQISFKQKAALNVHKHFKHSPSSQKICPTCGEFIAQKSDLNFHIKAHYDPSILICKICSKEFKLRSTLNKHMVLHQKKKLNALHRCDQCGDEFSRKAYLAEHQWKHTGNIMPLSHIKMYSPKILNTLFYSFLSKFCFLGSCF